ncbi:hypothetical protein PSV08DRAFT_385284 [Bipolaris maydis]|uniref:uncharacterized protein n=1 Tax=Cochliobolus heterostrophus TaxID=5016 RepID=UPI0024D0DED8|nr:hypothetical protein J3E73DRAFT_397967 [Bipolaris maydis]KAJ6265171.1 hypothetical protein PSV08DRAFT_385284 [Bipolaris maydis]KAJ6280899.1 hypothetical protein J3E71DRAFT_381801 [Bipolaris maydis]
MSRPATLLLKSRPSTSRRARHHTSLPCESDVNRSPSSYHKENTSESCAKPPSPPVSCQPSLHRPRSPTPEIRLSGWQPVEPSPALWVFLKNLTPPPSAPEYEAPSSEEQTQVVVVPLQTDCDGSRCDSVVDGDILPRAARNGKEMDRGVHVDVKRQEDRAQGIRRVWGRVRGWMCLGV